MSAYCTAQDIYNRYDEVTTRLWALSAKTDATAGGADTDARIAAAIAYASAHIDDVLRTTSVNFDLPLLDSNGAIPLTVVDISVKLAGYWLSTRHGIRDYDEKGKPITRLQGDRDDAEKTLQDIASGQLQLDVR